MNTTTSTQSDEHLIAAPGEPIINVAAFTARQKVGGYVGSHISHLMGGDEPSLILSQKRLVWRVPILLTTPERGPLGVVGHLDVDARTGRLLVPADFAANIQNHAEAFIAGSPS